VAERRGRAAAIDAFSAAYPEEEARRREAAATAEHEVERRLAELAEAEQELTAAREDEARERAQHAAERARDHVAVAEAAVARTTAAAAELERDASALPDEVPLLEARARSISDEVEHVPAPPVGVRDLVEWASHAHAELFVAAGQLDVQRERGIR